MGKLIVVVGNVASGKTTLTGLLKNALNLLDGIEDLNQRPFQQDFMRDRQRYGFQNQMDFLLVRAEQEAAIRAAARNGIQDGGLEMDHHVFTHLFAQKGYLSQRELALCQRFYALTRHFLPPPDLVIWLDVKAETARQRFIARARPIDIITPDDIARLEALLSARLQTLRTQGVPVLRVDANRPDPGLQRTAKRLIKQIRARGFTG